MGAIAPGAGTTDTSTLEIDTPDSNAVA